MFLTLQASQGNLVIDYKDWQIPLGRRFRWFLGSFPLEAFSLFLSLYLYIDIFVFGIEISIRLLLNYFVPENVHAYPRLDT